MRYQEVISDLRTAYDGGAAQRDVQVKQDFKVAEREAFCQRLRAEGATSLLEIGAGTGQDARYFADAGLAVVATDLSPEMVARCRAKGLDAHVMDFMSLSGGPFDAVHAVNCLLHVPNADLPAVLARIHAVLRPGGLLFIGVWGGESSEGPHAGDDHIPPRFFCMRTDAQLQSYVSEKFAIVDFHVVDPGGRYRFQTLTARA